jgi:hypothetical protein
MGDELFDPGLRRRALEVQVKRDLLKSAGRAAKVVLVSHTKSGPNVNLRLFDGDLVEWRKLRQLGEQSKSCTGDDVLERGRSRVVATTLRRLV